MYEVIKALQGQMRIMIATKFPFSARTLLSTTLQSLTGKYREIQGKPCNENREPAMRTGFPCNESRYFPVGIDLQGFPVSCAGFGFAVRKFRCDRGRTGRHFGYVPEQS